MYVVYGLLLIALLFVCDNENSRKYYVPLKVACSASFLVLGFLAGSDSLLMTSFILCFLGDFFMALYNQNRAKWALSAGILTFFGAHAGFIRGFYLAQPGFSWLAVIVPFAVLLIMIVVYKLAHLHMGSMILPGAMYLLMVSSMCVKALMVGGLTAAGGFLFFASDMSIVFLYFYHFKNKTLKRLVHYFNLVTYYVAIALFILSVQMPVVH